MLSKTEWELILHRLEATDAIADCLSEDGVFEYDVVTKRTEELIKGGVEVVDWTSELDIEILRDCCEGCTLFSGLREEVALGSTKKWKLLNMYRAASALERKLGCGVCRT